MPATGNGYYRAPFELPDGASLCYLGLYGYDTSATHMSANLVTYSGGFQAITGNAASIPATTVGVNYGTDIASTTGIGYDLCARPGRDPRTNGGFPRPRTRAVKLR
jgi:hypothetical protein